MGALSEWMAPQNLEQHFVVIPQLRGFKESVGGAYRGCRECMATKLEMESVFVHALYEMRCLPYRT